MFSRRPLAIVAVLAALLPSAHAAEPTCKVVDLMPEFWAVVGGSRDQSPEQQIEAFRTTLVDQHPGLFGKSGLGFDSVAQLDSAILKSLADARRDEGSMQVMVSLVEAKLPSFLRAFRAVFPDLRCDFSIYITPSLDRLDGAEPIHLLGSPCGTALSLDAKTLKRLRDSGFAKPEPTGEERQAEDIEFAELLEFLLAQGVSA